MSTERAPWLSEDQQRAWRGWLFTHRRLETAIARQLSRDTGLSLADFEVLVQLSEAEPGGLRIAELADALQWERSRLSHQLRRMVSRGLVDRRGSPEDGRGAYAAITSAGLAQIRRAAPSHAAQVRHLMFDEMPAADLVALQRITSRLVARLEAGDADDGS